MRLRKAAGLSISTFPSSRELMRRAREAVLTDYGFQTGFEALQDLLRTSFGWEPGVMLDLDRATRQEWRVPGPDARWWFFDDVQRNLLGRRPTDQEWATLEAWFETGWGRAFANALDGT